MKQFLLVALVAAPLLFACRKHEPAPPPPQNGSASVEAAASLPPPPPAVAARAENAPRDNVEGKVDPVLTTQLRTFVQKQGRLPASFAEFKNLGLDSIPEPPPGTKWVIDRATTSVKAIPAR